MLIALARQLAPVLIAKWQARQAAKRRGKR